MTIDSADDSKISNRIINTNRISNRMYDSKSNRITKLRRSLHTCFVSFFTYDKCLIGAGLQNLIYKILLNQNWFCYGSFHFHWHSPLYLIVLCEYWKFRIESNCYFSIWFEMGIIIRNFWMLTTTNFLLIYRVPTPPGKSWIFSWKFNDLESPGKISLKMTHFYWF